MAGSTADRFDRIEFTIVRSWQGTGVDVRINGTPLRDLVEGPRTYEAWDTPDPNETDSEARAAHAISLIPLKLVASPGRQWLGDPDHRYRDGDRAGVLSCLCGDFGCGGSAARITIDDDIVTWADFRYDEDIDDEDIGPFRFDRATYEQQLAALLDPED